MSNDTKKNNLWVSTQQRPKRHSCECQSTEYPPKPKPLHQGPVAHKNPCTTKTCRYCPKINKSGTVTSTYTTCNYSSKTRVDCKSGNLICCIACKTCELQYVGTKRRLMDRSKAISTTSLPKSLRTPLANTLINQIIMVFRM